MLVGRSRLLITIGSSDGFGLSPLAKVTYLQLTIIASSIEVLRILRLPKLSALCDITLRNRLLQLCEAQQSLWGSYRGWVGEWDRSDGRSERIGWVVVRGRKATQSEQNL